MATITELATEQNTNNRSPQSALADYGLIGDLVGIVFSPGEVLRGLPKNHRIAWILVIYLVAVSAIGYATFTTGVLSREINERTERALGQLRMKHDADEEVETANALIESTDKGRVFTELMAKGWEVIGRPIWSLFSILMLAGVLFGLVAFRGGKPNFTVLCGLTVLAALSDIPQLLLRLLLMSQLNVSRVETSAAAFAVPSTTELGAYLMLRRINPFELWHWFILGFGLVQLRMLKRGSAIFWIGLLWVIAATLRSSLEASTLADLSALMQQQATK